MFSAVSRDKKRSRGQCLHGRDIPKISGFLMTEPICLSACCPAFCTLTWESVSTSVSLGTMLGKQDDSCLGAQYAMAPSNSTDPADSRHTLTEHRPRVTWADCQARDNQSAPLQTVLKQSPEGGQRGPAPAETGIREIWLSPGSDPRPSH